MNLRILLVESDTEDVLFLRDVLEDMEGSEFWSGWLHLDVFDAPSCSFAKAILVSEPIDVILLDLDLADSRGGETFRKVQAVAPNVPVVLLIDDGEHESAERLIREGAQDFLIKKHIDCEPLAHAMRNAVERHRLLAAARTSSMVDPLTGLLNRAAFQRFADRDRKIAEASGGRMAVLVAESRDTEGWLGGFREQQRDLRIMEAADLLRTLAHPTDLVARLGDGLFAISVLESAGETVEEAWARFSSSPGSQTLAFGAATFGPDRYSSLDGLLEQAEEDLAPIDIVPAVLAKHASN